ncbi:MAG: hypothetical protein J6386_21440 [Candidatus Synoicihabitans palmerolidicus]|nr:hypothetical protein [Candidatus Synoicihabitans palmerolidicus]
MTSSDELLLEIARREGWLSAVQEAAAAEVRRADASVEFGQPRSLARVLIDQGIFSERDACGWLAVEFGLSVVELAGLRV